jgi:protein TonB
MVALSTVGHLLLGIAAVTVPGILPRSAPPRWDNVMLGSLAELPPAGGPAAPAPPAEAAPEPAAAPPRPAEASPPPPPPEPRKKPVKKEPSPAKTAKKIEPEPAEPVASAAPGASAGTGTGTPATAGSSAAAGTTDGPGTGSGVSVGGGGAFVSGFGYYIALIDNKLAANYAEPVHPGGGGDTLAVRLIFRIGQRGQVSDVRVEIPSPYPALDSAALRAVYRSAPFPPLPPQWTNDSVLLAATFELKPVGL